MNTRTTNVIRRESGIKGRETKQQLYNVLKRQQFLAKSQVFSSDWKGFHVLPSITLIIHTINYPLNTTWMIKMYSPGEDRRSRGPTARIRKRVHDILRKEGNEGMMIMAVEVPFDASLWWVISRDVYEGMDDEKDVLKKRQTVAQSLSLFLWLKHILSK